MIMSSPAAKIFLFSEFLICRMVLPFRADERGVRVTNVVRNTVDVGVSRDERRICVRRNRVVLAPRGLALKSKQN
jgi:hypothetical protein